jgi:phage/plasmid-like protein (TIGR03299 family)
MSKESVAWLNTMTLIGFTDTRGSAWHFDEDSQGSEPNHYPGAIPIEDVRRRLFNWEPVEAKLQVILPDGTQITDKERKAIVRPDTKDIFGIFKSGYQIHSYDEWLLNQVSTILDDKLQIGSAGLLRKGAQAWVQVEVNENITTPEGVEFRPHLLASTSLDGSLATSYGRSVVNTVCDNTMSASLSSMGDQKLKLKHTKYSRIRITEAHEALAIVHEIGDAFAAEVAELTNIIVTDGDWEKFLNEINPIPADEGRGKTVAQNKRDILTGMWESDSRVKPWAGTAWGVVQAINTYSHWENSAHNEENNPNARNERNMARAVKGDVDKLDKETLSTLQAVLA